MKRTIASTAFFLTLAFTGFAQQEPLVSHYMFNHLLINPAYAGSKDFAMVSLLYRTQWTGLDGAPKSVLGSINGPVFKSRKVGLGLTLSNDKIGVTNSTDIYGDYAYHIPLSDKFKLGLGAKAGISYISEGVPDKLIDDNDPLYQADRSKIVPNLGAGAYLHSRTFYFGVSSPRLITYDPDRPAAVGDTASETPAIVRHYWVTSGAAFEVSPDFVIRPSIMLRASKNVPLQADINANFLIKQFLWLGATFRTGDEHAGMPEAVIGLVELQLTKQFRVGYSYDFTMSELSDYSGGSHEISLGYDFGRDVLKMKSPRYF
ncbi:MAG TPA: type IX secretion system membrane protein PorP/SprF [Chitinophagales bacterium]|nr:type IX secretion system membrane protein PorP/SprF [Chitinophagales bacterium]